MGHRNTTIMHATCACRTCPRLLTRSLFRAERTLTDPCRPIQNFHGIEFCCLASLSHSVAIACPESRILYCYLEKPCWKRRRGTLLGPKMRAYLILASEDAEGRDACIKQLSLIFFVSFLPQSLRLSSPWKDLPVAV